MRGRADWSTVEWWMQLRNMIWRGKRSSRCLKSISSKRSMASKSGSARDKPVWGNGATFDNVILSNAFAACNIERPWSYKSDRCYRTLKSFAPDVKALSMSA